MFLKALRWRFARSLQWKLVSIFISITLFLMIIVWFLLISKVESSYYNNFKTGIERGFNTWGLKDKDNPSLEEIEKELVEDKNSIYYFTIAGDFRSYTIMSKYGEIIQSNDLLYYEDAEEFLNQILESKNLKVAMAGQVGNQERLTRIGSNKAFFDYAKPIGDYIIYFQFDRDEWIETINDFNQIIVTSLTIAVVISLILGYILSKTITIPVIRIMHKAQKVASGDFDHVLEVKSNDEIGKLTNTFNYMAKELKKTLMEVSSEKSKIETILNNVTDGVIAFNLKGEVMHSNPAAKVMLDVDEIQETMNSFSQKYGLGVTLEQIQFLGSPTISEKNIHVKDKVIKTYLAPFMDEYQKLEGVIVVLQDITEQEKLENMRREFVANVSHELKTPLTSIKSYTETLLDGALEDRETAESFLAVINSESDRMSRLVKDLLQLSSLDNRQTHWNIREFSFVDLVKNTVDKLKLESKSKGQLLESFVIGDIPDIQADHDRIEQVAINILSNAIKYTPKEGKVTVYIGKTSTDVYMKVADTGIGIPEEDVHRVFERFYRVDKARSREMGGTGLGLAIAKEIVEAHGGNISITSENGKGTEVMVRLPYVTQT